MSYLESVPQRLSDAERDDAVAALRAHLEAGRLTNDEFSTRMNSALAARTASQMAPLFADLPQPHPECLAAVQPTWNTYPTGGREPEPGAPQGRAVASYTPGVPATRPQSPGWLNTIHALIWPVAIFLVIFGRAGPWPILAAIVISTVLGSYQGQRRRRTPPPY